MRNKLLKIASLLIVAILLVTTFSACSSYDEDYAIYDVWVAGVKVTTRNRTDILGDGTVSYEGDGKSGTLTLNGTNIAECSDTEMEAFIVSTIDNLTLNLVGENKIGMGEKAPVNGISAYGLTVKWSIVETIKASISVSEHSAIFVPFRVSVPDLPSPT